MSKIYKTIILYTKIKYTGNPVSLFCCPDFFITRKPDNLKTKPKIYRKQRFLFIIKCQASDPITTRFAFLSTYSRMFAV